VTTRNRGRAGCVRREGRFEVALTGDRAFVESYIGALFGKLALEPAPEIHRRVLAVLTFLQAR
jgi:hypothetical protein